MGVLKDVSYALNPSHGRRPLPVGYGLYSDATAKRQDLVSLRRRIAVIPRTAGTATLSDVSIRLKDGREISAAADVAVWATDVTAQWDLLQAKFHALAQPIIGQTRVREVVARCRELDNEPSVRPLMKLVG